MTMKASENKDQPSSPNKDNLKDCPSLKESVLKRSVERRLSRLPPDEVRLEAQKLIELADSFQSRNSHPESPSVTVDSSPSRPNSNGNVGGGEESFVAENDESGSHENRETVKNKKGPISQTSMFGNYIYSSFRTSQDISTASPSKQKQPGTDDTLDKCEELLENRLRIMKLRRPFELQKEAMKLLELERNQLFSQSTDETSNETTKKLFVKDLVETLDKVYEKRRQEYFENQLPHDMFSIIMLIPQLLSFENAVVIFSLALQIISAGLFFSSKTYFTSYEFNPWNLPANVNVTARFAQVIALFIALFTQDDLIISIAQIFEGYEALEEAFHSYHLSRIKWMISIFVRMNTSLFILFVTWLVIVQQETVVDVFLEFVAITFVGQLDNAFFFIASKGLLGKKCQILTFHITSEHYFMKRNVTQSKKWRFLSLVLPLLVLMTPWSYIVYLQNSGHFLAKSIAVQFGDDFLPLLGTFSGVYDIQSGKTINGRSYYRERKWGKSFLAYCNEQNAWTLSYAKAFDELKPCDYMAKSSESSIYDVSEMFSEKWTVAVQDRGDNELQHLWARSLDCRFDRNTCGNNGKCVQYSSTNDKTSVTCICNEGWYGLLCNFKTPCDFIEVDERNVGFRGTRKWSSHFHTLKFEDNSPTSLYFRPVYVNEKGSGYDIIMYTGRRWVVTSSDQIDEVEKLRQINDTHTVPLSEDALANYITHEFQPFSTSWSVDFISENIDIGTPNDVANPVGISWFNAKKNSQAVGFFSVEPSNEQNAPFICSQCNNETNVCFYDSLCRADGTCECMNGGKGTLCQVTPQKNGMCDEFFNTIAFDYDGGDCCQATCEPAEFQCGIAWNKNKDLFVYAGFVNCKDPAQVCESCWKQLSNVVYSQETALNRYSFVGGSGRKYMDLSKDGKVLIVSDGAASEGVQAYILDGTSWVEKGTLNQDPDKSPWFGESLAISGDGKLFGASGLVSDRRGDLQVFKYNEFQWRLIKKMTGESSDALFGTSISFSYEGDYLAVRSPGTGKVHTYVRSVSEGYVQLGNPIQISFANDDVGYGIALSSDGKSIAIGYTSEGESEVYSWKGNYWEILGDALPGPSFSEFGASIAISDDGKIVAVGAPEADLSHFEAGLVSVFVWNGIEWKQRGESIIGDSERARLGHSVSLSSDGSILAVGGDKDASNTVSAKVFQWNGNNQKWERLGGFIPGGLVNLVKLSGDGSTIAVSVLNGRSPNVLETSLYQLIQQGNQCEEGFSQMILSVLTDQRPGETHFRLTDSTGYQLFSEYYPEGSVGSFYKEMCIANDECLSLELFDTNGDGICCSNGNGSYAVWMNGEEVASGGEFKYYDKVLIGKCEPICPDGKQLFRTEILTDEYGSEIHWGFKIEGSNNILMSGGSYPDDILQFIVKETCIDTDKCHIFDIVEDCEWLSYWIPYNPNCGLGFEDVLDSESIYPTHRNRPEEIRTGYSLNLNGIEIGNSEGYKVKRSHRIGSCGPACGDGKSLFRIGIRTDGYGDEITWSFREEVEETNVLEGGPYQVVGYEIQEICVDTKNHCYMFTIYDSYGDGMMNSNCVYICAGGYALILDEQELKFGGEFGFSESFRFGNCVPTLEPTQLPSVSESAVPTQSPSLSSQPTMCSGPSSDLIELNITPDQNGEELTWNLTDTKDSSITTLLSGGPYPDYGSTYSYSFCMDLDTDCYLLRLYDTGCNGFCSGSSCYGNYTIGINGLTVVFEERFGCLRGWFIGTTCNIQSQTESKSQQKYINKVP